MYNRFRLGVSSVQHHIVTFMTVAGADTYGCLKILGGAGFSEDESCIPVYCLMGACFVYCYGWPLLVGRSSLGVSSFD